MVHVSGPVSDPICDKVAALCDKGERGEGREGEGERGGERGREKWERGERWSGSGCMMIMS